MVGNILFNLFIEPLELLFEVVFSVARMFIEQPLFLLIALSIVVNLIVLPLYNRADSIQQEENERQARMAHWVDHIKRTFRGDERYMMTATYYRQQGYKSYYMLRSSFALLLQIPFFIAAYDYLSHLEALNDMSFWVIPSLGAPDGLLVIGSLQINVLPIIMTVINVVSSYIYLKGAGISQKIQTYGLALVFLVLLYSSPSGLVIYWTCNQIFSLLKNVYQKLVRNRMALGILVSVVGIALFIYMLTAGRGDTAGKRVFLILVLIACQIPLVTAFIRKRKEKTKTVAENPVTFKVYMLAAVFMTIFMGLVIPLSVLSSSPKEFVSYGNTPWTILVNTFCMMAGVFIIWCGVYYYLGTPGMRRVFACILTAFSGVAAVNFFFFGLNLGVLSDKLAFDNIPEYPSGEMILNGILAAAVIVVCVFLVKILKKYMVYVLAVACAAAIGLCVTLGSSTAQGLRDGDVSLTKIKAADAEPLFNFSREGKNVVIVMLDRAIGAMVPYIFEEKPEIKEAFSGFTYYSNTLSFGGSTNLAIPALYGGYEYTPTEMNRKSDQLLVDKHNEALRMMPTIFSENGYRITFTDPAYPNYSVTPDLTVFDGIDNLKAYTTIGKYECEGSETVCSAQSKIQSQNFFFYSFFKAVPEALQNAIYDKGNYFRTDDNYYTSEAFMDSYAVLSALPQLSEVLDDSQGTFTFIENETTHSPTVLTYPDYEIGIVKKDSIYDQMDDYVINGRKMKMDNWSKVCHYKANLASLMKLGEWFDYLREEGIWDNTRIIICSDHGRPLGNGGQFDELMESDTFDAEKLNPLLLFKDFNSNTLTVSDEFMTNADVPTLALGGLIDHPVNPATGKEINSHEKTAHPQVVTTSDHYRPNADHPTRRVFNTTDGEWWAVKENVFDKNNWTYLYAGDEPYEETEELE